MRMPPDLSGAVLALSLGRNILKNHLPMTSCRSTAAGMNYGHSADEGSSADTKIVGAVAACYWLARASAMELSLGSDTTSHGTQQGLAASRGLVQNLTQSQLDLGPPTKQASSVLEHFPHDAGHGL